MAKVIDEALNKLNSGSNGELEPHFTVAQLQSWSGESESCWRKRIARGELRVVKFGANTRIPKSSLDEWLRQTQAGNE